MKAIITTMIMLCSAMSTIQAQTFSEWFRQNATQKKYLLEQIAALKVYGNYAKKGYGIVKDGLGGIGRNALSEFKDHQNYFDSKKAVSPAVKSYRSTYEAFELYEKIIKDCKHYTKVAKDSKYIMAQEKDYVYRVFSRLRQDCDAARHSLEVVATDYSVGMSDAERIERIDAICAEMRNQYDFGRRFGSEMKSLIISRQRSEIELRKSRELYGY